MHCTLVRVYVWMCGVILLDTLRYLAQWIIYMCILGCICFVGKLCMYNSLSVCYSGHCETTWTVLVLGPKWPTLCVWCYTSDAKVQVSLYLHSWPSLPSCSWVASLWLTPINAHFTWCNVLPMTVKTSIGHPWDDKVACNSTVPPRWVSAQSLNVWVSTQFGSHGDQCSQNLCVPFLYVYVAYPPGGCNQSIHEVRVRPETTFIKVSLPYQHVPLPGVWWTLQQC